MLEQFAKPQKVTKSNTGFARRGSQGPPLHPAPPQHRRLRLCGLEHEKYRLSGLQHIDTAAVKYYYSYVRFSFIYSPTTTSSPGSPVRTRWCKARSLPPLLPGGASCLNTFIKADPKLFGSEIGLSCVRYGLAPMDYCKGKFKAVQGSMVPGCGHHPSSETDPTAPCRGEEPSTFQRPQGRERLWQSH